MVSCWETRWALLAGSLRMLAGAPGMVTCLCRSGGAGRPPTLRCFRIQQRGSCVAMAMGTWARGPCLAAPSLPTLERRQPGWERPGCARVSGLRMGSLCASWSGRHPGPPCQEERAGWSAPSWAPRGCPGLPHLPARGWGGVWLPAPPLLAEQTQRLQGGLLPLRVNQRLR